MPRYFALLPAAGVGQRMGSACPKQYMDLLGQPLLAHTIGAILRCSFISKVWVVLSPEDDFWTHSAVLGALLTRYNGRLSVLRVGGASRAQSVLNGLSAMGSEVAADDWVLVHDAARPCVQVSSITRMKDELGNDPVGGLLAVPVADTLKRADNENRVLATLDRKGLWLAQTPQMFRYGLLCRALQACATVTDEASAVEAYVAENGMRPKLVASDLSNLKVTYPSDLKLASLILQENFSHE